ncbi:NAD-dependent epimerase/dehydratase family protein [Aquimarina sp. U1-2]|uniref:NAD-dependent epimerase/dehydratase family protein n=1 Tax=Aquimarina sp. U1-2 TaxID=2823141 RepID=UPI001AED0985|nr:NAD-dependent epimerase/dehydratase family protein [Aquimarina sp. U1-2]MBP2831421.1 NAD-dependent epimerase/dehydratase family protein [Aquimarina sp. U1-2]
MILVTGATGLVGTHLLVKLIQQKQHIRALYRSDAKKKQARKVFSYYFNAEESTLFDTIDWVKADLEDIPTLTEAFDQVDYVYHCAAWITFNPRYTQKIRKINIEGTANIVNLCLLHAIKKLCYVSSIATLEHDLIQPCIDETAEWNPETLKSIYAISKYGAEMEVWRGTQEGLKAVIVNPGIIIGPGFFDNGSGYLFRKINKGLRYYTQGITGYVAIEDVVDIMQQLMIGSHHQERYILVGENLSYKKVFSMIAKALDKPSPSREASSFLLKSVWYLQWIGYLLFGIKRSIFRSTIHNAKTISVYNNEKIKNELAYTFTPIEKAIQKTATYFLNQ